MTLFLIVCLGAIMSDAIFFLVARLALLREKYVCQRAIAEMEHSNEIVLLVRDVANAQARLSKHAKIRNDLEGINHAFSMRFLDCKEVKVVKVRSFNNIRVALLNDYKMDQAGTKMLRWILPHILIPFLHFLQCVLHEFRTMHRRTYMRKRAVQMM